MLISPCPELEGNKLQRQKILSFIYPIYKHNWRNISTIYICNKTSIKRNILTIKQNIYREVGRTKDLSAPLVSFSSPIPVAALSYDRSFVAIAGSNSTGARKSVSCECCVLSGRGLCDGPIIRPEESYGV